MESRRDGTCAPPEETERLLRCRGRRRQL